VAELLINVATKKLLDAYLKSPAHALLLCGESGVGLGSIANMLARELSESEQTVTSLLPEKGLISIERVRTLYEQTRSIQDGKRVIIIDDADSMSPDAQNALLKLLEEPVENVHFVLTTHAPNQLLSTIRSRAQAIRVLNIDETMSKQLLANYSLDATKHAQTLFLASGRPAELTRLAEDEEYFAAKAGVVSDARTFLQTDAYGRLMVIKKYTDRAGALEFLTMCGQLLRFSFLKQKNVSAAENMEVFDLVMKRIEANGHARTHLMHLVTKLS